ncbi:hypothetical protein RRG08_025878 [Elysia crispata]|uniref:Uncharacterized protein n=1 Tax=Elysia crispata TaxID=231223 RepID=A0AAE0ZPW7_9GAST|nr:hypothetical protein RRG08_025878 [Elysia crispata]
MWIPDFNIFTCCVRARSEQVELEQIVVVSSNSCVIHRSLERGPRRWLAGRYRSRNASRVHALTQASRYGGWHGRESSCGVIKYCWVDRRNVSKFLVRCETSSHRQGEPDGCHQVQTGAASHVRLELFVVQIVPLSKRNESSHVAVRMRCTRPTRL